MTYPISLCMIVRNEERFLGDALASVRGVVDEICIADTGSTDGSVAIAESFGARITHVAWNDDFSAARNAALAMAGGAWIFVLDADERLAPDSHPHLAALRAEQPDGRGRWIRCRNLSDAQRETVGSTNAIVRIFPNDPSIRYRGTLHEFVARDGDERSLGAAMTPIEILHYGYLPEIMSERGKGERNLRVSRLALEAAPADPSLAYNYAMSALLAGERAIAREQLESVITLTRDTPRGFRPMALATLAGLYLDDSRIADALGAAGDCVAIAPTLPDGHFALGRAFAAAGRYNDARASFRAAIEAGRSFAHEHFVVDDEIAAWKAQNEIAITLLRERRYDEARRCLDDALALRPGERTLMLNRARCCEAQGDMAARAAFRAVFEAFRDETAAIEYVNYVFRHGTPDMVVSAVETALPALGEDYQQAFLTSAAAGLVRAGRLEEASSLLGRVLAIGDEPAKARAIIEALAQQYGVPELNGLTNDLITAP